eukprot:scaffold96120_cov53-Phaeocystis_antarctica.AAC.2
MVLHLESPPSSGCSACPHSLSASAAREVCEAGDRRLRLDRVGAGPQQPRRAGAIMVVQQTRRATSVVQRASCNGRQQTCARNGMFKSESKKRT